MANAIVVYFTQSGNTEKLAKIIAEKVGADIKKIDDAKDLSAYDTVYVGTPNWAAGAPDPVKNYLKEVDVSGKTVVPFCTHGMGGLQNVGSDIESLSQGAAKVLKPFAIKGVEVDSAPPLVTVWLTELGLI